MDNSLLIILAYVLLGATQAVVNYFVTRRLFAHFNVEKYDEVIMTERQTFVKHKDNSLTCKKCKEVIKPTSGGYANYWLMGVHVCKKNKR